MPAEDSEHEVTQAGLSSWSRLQVVESMNRKSVSDPVRCPDCGRSISSTKGGQPLPDEVPADSTFGWRCSNCHNVIPCRAFNPDADGFNDRFRGLEVEFRDGHERYIPVPVSKTEVGAGV